MRMRKMWGILGILAVIFTGCKSSNKVYSNTTLNRAYKEDPRWNYRGYNPNASEEEFRRYNPDRNDDIMEELHSRKEDNTKENN